MSWRNNEEASELIRLFLEKHYRSPVILDEKGEPLMIEEGNRLVPVPSGLPLLFPHSKEDLSDRAIGIPVDVKQRPDLYEMAMRELGKSDDIKAEGYLPC